MSKLNSTQTSNSMFTSASLLLRLLIYISVAGAISLPSYISDNHNLLERVNFFSRFEKPEEREAAKNLNALNLAHISYNLENNRLADSISELGIAIQPETSDYHYRIVQPMIPVQDLDASVTPDLNLSMRMALAQKNVKDNFQHYYLKNYLAIVYTRPETYASGQTEIVTRFIFCEMTREKPLPTTMPTLTNGDYECPAGSKQLTHEIW